MFKKIIGVIAIVVLIANLVLFILGKISFVSFWIGVALIALTAWILKKTAKYK